MIDDIPLKIAARFSDKEEIKLKLNYWVIAKYHRFVIFLDLKDNHFSIAPAIDVTYFIVTPVHIPYSLSRY